jgi:hypothetical protein
MGVFLRLLGVIDILIASSIILFELGVIPFWVFLPFALDLLVKGVLFRTGAATAIDIGIAVYLLCLPFLGLWVISCVVAVYLLQKGVFSLL